MQRKSDNIAAPLLPFCQGIPESQGPPTKGKKTKESEAWPKMDKSLPFSLGDAGMEGHSMGKNHLLLRVTPLLLTLQTCGSLLSALD